MMTLLRADAGADAGTGDTGPHVVPRHYSRPDRVIFHGGFIDTAHGRRSRGSGNAVLRLTVRMSKNHRLPGAIRCVPRQARDTAISLCFANA